MLGAPNIAANFPFAAILLFSKKNVMAIELQDLPENIFQRLVFSDENDEIYKEELHLLNQRKHLFELYGYAIIMYDL
ncbi:MAG: hypothetical protein SA378_10995 [Sedimentibacter sp.]|uniref:hypothetical protein n=1 Tax=Sedimentibacter sp. TaxID=1960295 RepID=UPI0029811414|nr:hypothetical protein [Sedimentibacter sp.]MDW5300643.1 hypothetical protein [Sedimentibacter sp.]